MPWIVEAALLGTAGGFMVALVDFVAKVDQWRGIREKAQADGEQRPKLAACVDLPAQFLGASLKILLGLLAGGVFGHTGLISDPAGAVAMGAAAPALLRRLGSAQTVQEALSHLPPDGQSAEALQKGKTKEKEEQASEPTATEPESAP